MFYRYVKRKYEEGKISIGLKASAKEPAVYVKASDVYLETSDFLASIALTFLNDHEKEVLGMLAKDTAPVISQ